MSLSARRAWIEIIRAGPHGLGPTQSLSARRAWIEITRGLIWRVVSGVALRKESVDRNCANVHLTVAAHASLSARRAWIEIQWVWMPVALPVSLSARRAWIEISKYAL